MIRITIIIITSLITINLQSQDIYEQKTKNIFNNIIKSIGNNFNRSPKIEFVNTEKNPAKFRSKNKTIYIEKKVINLFKDHANFEDIIAYMIGHELAHHYLNHGWMKNVDFAYSSTTRNFLIDESDVNQRKKDEIQADIFGGFYAKISGFDALNFGEVCLKTIYNQYNIKEEIKGYPSLKERIEIIESNITKTNELADLFYIGNLALIIGEYELANNCFIEILNNNFSSREIYNNLGLASLLKAINLLDKSKSKYIFPIYIDQNTRADNKLSRSALDSDLMDLLKSSLDNFDRSIQKDQDYLPAKINRLNTEFIHKLITNNLNKDFYNFLISKTDLDKKRVNDLIVLYKIVSSKKLTNKDIESGSVISKLNSEIYKNKAYLVSKNFQIPKYDKIENDFFLGIPKPYNILRYDGGNIKKKEYGNYKLIEYFNDNHLFIITDKKYLEDLSKTIQHQKFSRIFELNSKTYKISNPSKIVFEFDSDSKLIAVIQYDY